MIAKSHEQQKSENNKEKSLIQILQLSTHQMFESDPLTKRLFFLIGLLPDMISISELGQFWTLTQETEPLEAVLDKLCAKNTIMIKEGEEDRYISMAKATRVYATDLSSASGDRSELLYLIVCVHNTLLEHFYLNYNVSKPVLLKNKDKVTSDLKMDEATYMLQEPCKYGISHNLLNTLKLVKINHLNGK